MKAFGGRVDDLLGIVRGAACESWRKLCRESVARWEVSIWQRARCWSVLRHSIVNRGIRMLVDLQ